MNIILKEIKELVRDPKVLLPMIIIPLVMFPLMGFAIQTSVETAGKGIGTSSVALIDQDQGSVAQSLEAYLAAYNFSVTRLDNVPLEQALVQVQDSSNITSLIIIPSGFSQNITEDKTGDITIYTPFKGSGIIEATRSSTVKALLSSFEQIILDQRIKQGLPEANATQILNPMHLEDKSIVKGKGADVSPDVLFSLMMSQSTIMPVGMIMLLVFAMQLAATAVASEKEEKTLETLLTLPINRTMILAGKLTGSIIVALVGAVAYLIGFSYYMNSFMGFAPTESVDLAAIGLAPSLASYSVLGVSLFMALLAALALAISLSVFAEDVRGAQALVGPLSMLFVVPMVFAIFTDINALPFPISLILLAIPFTYPMLAANVSFTGNYVGAIGGIIYMAIFTIIVLYVAARLFGTEKILTAKLKFKSFSLRKKKK
jgi:ABC-2 type transport system permease protein